MTGPTLDCDGALRLLDEVAAEHPGRVGTRGRYLDEDGGCGCLVAHVLFRAGWKVSALREADRGSSTHGPVKAACLRAYIPELFAGLDAAAGRVLGAAQREQDDGATWADAAAWARQMAQAHEGAA